MVQQASIAPASSSGQHNPLFDQALQKHLESLQPEDKQAFENCTAEDVLATVEQLNSNYAAQSLSNIAASIPGAQIGAIVWGALKFVIKTINAISDHFERIVGVLEEIAQSLPFYQDYALGFIALADVYNDILVVCSAVRRVFLKRGGALRSGPSILIQSLNPWNKAIEDVTQGLRRRERYSSAKWRTQIAYPTTQTVSTVSDKPLRESGVNDRRRDILASLPYEDCHSKHEDCLGVLPPEHNTGNWLLNREEFLNWAYNPYSRMLWVHGKPGVGKTVLAAIVIEWARNALISGKRPAVAFFYCEHDNPKKHDPRSLLATLLHQVLRQLTIGPRDDLDLDALSATQSLDKLCTSLKAACACLERIMPVFLVVDALDECSTTTRKRLLPLLISLGRDVRLLLTSRKEGDIGNALRNTPSISITAEDVKGDIHEYVSRKIRLAHDEDFSDESLEVGDAALLEEVSRTLIEGANGMFLWVQLQISHLQEQRTDYDIRDALKSLTKGLEPTFSRILKSIDRLPPSRRARAKRVLRWVACAEHPLSLCELSEAIVIQDMQQSWDKSRCVTRPTSLIEDCFNLVFCTESSWQSPDAKVQLIHSSVKEFLLQDPVVLGESLADYHVYPFSEVQVTIVEDCLKYLQLITQAAMQANFGRNILELPDLLESDSFSCSVNSCSRHRPPDSSGLSVTTENAKTSFIRPCLYVTWPLDSPFHTLSDLSWKMALTLPEPKARTASNRRQLPLHAAAANPYGCASVQYLLSYGADVNALNDQLRTPLHAAAGIWHRGIDSVRVLLEHGAKVNATDRDGFTPLHMAAQSEGSGESVKLLLEHGAKANAVSRIERKTPLHMAAKLQLGREAARHLLDNGADIEATDWRMQTPLHVAAEQAFTRSTTKGSPHYAGLRKWD
ncbi:hypothetical protein B0F90DRAFT_1667745 [Multifurca ochricompacta]|uniref:NACHT domain-containing protein n=1 Tax=Multifurca ochricompacta TaxID=376703 RepID=A0AAD4M6E0_9AGAM|nr:hypothetical protein B0F90DRAFT_1667745 [Multifurca ochricompacta]